MPQGNKVLLREDQTGFLKITQIVLLDNQVLPIVIIL